MTATALGKCIRENRQGTGMTGRELAAEARISAPYLTDLEHGRRFPSPDVRQRIAVALGLRDSDLAALDPRLPDRYAAALKLALSGDWDGMDDHLGRSFEDRDLELVAAAGALLRDAALHELGRRHS
jgi:transcriptional regulator with XRE-family HTH domain